MTWRRLRVIIQHLPPESHTMTALRNALPAEELERQADEGEPEKGRWSQAEQLLAMVADRVARLEYVVACANTEKSKWPDPPEPLRRPGVMPRKKKPAAMTEAAAETLFRLINGGAA
ncbi:hypothetical protein ADK70_12370 [Streptomyces rimosus subsp. pseudoverticillatus]|nr:hypothetical protein ADK70_12370 [Streptomyces rimosus subsp. pseudoverticillatus]